MSKLVKLQMSPPRVDTNFVEVKSKVRKKSRDIFKLTHHCKLFFPQFVAEFRRFSLNKKVLPKYDDFRKMLEKLHSLQIEPFFISYTG